MIRHRLRIVLLALGVVLGYGSAFAQFRHHAQHHDHAHGCLWE